MTAGTLAAHTAMTPGVSQEIDGEHLWVTLNLTGNVDMLVRLARALRRTGTMRRFQSLGTVSSLTAPQLRSLLSEPDVRDALTLTLDPTQAEDMRDALDAATVADVCERCRRNYAVSQGMCAACQPQVIEP